MTKSIRFAFALGMLGVFSNSSTALAASAAEIDVRVSEAVESFKQEVRQPAWIEQFLQKPLPDRQEIAEGLRQASREAQANRPEAIGDAVSSEIELWMTRYSAAVLVHGHTHRPAIQPTENGLRAVTSDWGYTGIGIFADTLDSEQIISLAHLGPTGPVISEQWSRQAGMPEWKRNS